MAQFRSHRHNFQDAAIRLRPDPEQGRSMQLIVHEKSLLVSAGPSAHANQVYVVNARLAMLWEVDERFALASYSTPPEAHFASNVSGAANVLHGTGEEHEALHKKMHPDAAEVWDQSVGGLD